VKALAVIALAALVVYCLLIAWNNETPRP